MIELVYHPNGVVDSNGKRVELLSDAMGLR